MKQYRILAGISIGLMFILSGCQKQYYNEGLPFTMDTSQLPGYSNAEILALAEDNYERFMHASYIQVTDKFGNFHKIKISADIDRHDWDFSNLQTDGTIKNLEEQML